ncbi:MAG: flagellar export chaperone FliS [Microbacteriaceae bacterium]|nr:MAG: flagellar export chaperone FliS [Microbacteriaceae bacterium]
MTTHSAQLAQYNRNVILSATPMQVVIMLYDRLVLDVKRAEAAQELEDWSAAHLQLLHAQDIVNELSSSLTVDAWDGAAGLFAIYSYLRNTLMTANISRDIDRTREALRLVEPLSASWHEAARLVALPAAAPIEGLIGVG